MNLAKWRSASLSLAIISSVGFPVAQVRAQAPATPAASAAASPTTPPLAAQTTTTSPPPAAAVTSPSAPPISVPNAPILESGPEQGSPGVPSGATVETVDVPARAIAMLTGKAKWDDGFAAIKDSLAKIEAALEKAGLKPAGSPFTVFTETDDNGFSYEAMVPLAAKPTATLAGDVQLASSPSGKAIKFQHRGPYDDIDSTYDLVTAYLDEKGLEARDFFVEEYLSELTDAEDPNMAVDIYVFLK